MTTPRKVSYVFARLKRHRIHRDPTRKRIFSTPPVQDISEFWDKVALVTGARWPDYVTLIPPTPVHADALRNGFEHAVQSLPEVDYDGVEWKCWTDSDSVSEPSLPPELGQGCTVFLVPEADYEKLSEERDDLGELRQARYERYPAQAPSKGATPEKFRNMQSSRPLIGFYRPFPTNSTLIPLCLLQREFGEFQDNLRSAPLDPTLSPHGYAWLPELSNIFESEKDREAKFHTFLEEILASKVRIASHAIGRYQADAGVKSVNGFELSLCGLPLLGEVKLETTVGTNADGVFEVVLCYTEATRRIAVEKICDGDRRKTRLPAILICHNGPNIQVFGALCLEAPQVQILSQPVSLYFNPLEERTMEDFLRFLFSLRKLFHSLLDVYRHPLLHAVPSDQIEFPYINHFSPLNDGAKVSFRYTSRIDTIRLVFTAQLQDGTNRAVIVKFGPKDYGLNAHRDAADKGLTPAILGFTDSLPGGMWMVVMEMLDADYKGCHEYNDNELPQDAVDQIRTTMDRFHELGYVHGDARESNVFLRQCEGDGRWECQLLDMDWAGCPGQAKYPIGVYDSKQVWRPEEHLDQQDITIEHDRLTLERWLSRKGARG